MQRTKVSARLISLVLTLTILLSVFSVFAFAAESADSVSPDELSVAFNRTFSEGWDYTNGIVDALAKGNTAGLAYEYRNSSYNYYLRLDKQNTKVSYLYIDTQNRLAKSGKTFIELDLTSGAGCAMGQAVRVSVRGDIKTLVEFRDDGMYILGENVGTSVYDFKWESVAFEFDFDYVSADTLDTAYKVTAYHNGQKLAERIWAEGANGKGISQVRFSFGDVRDESIGSWYGVDNIRIYSGVDKFTTLKTDNYGLAVDSELARDFNLAGNMADPDGYLRGTPSVDRLDGMGTAYVHYNRNFSEGWDLSNGALVVPQGNDLGIRGEKKLDGTYNYFYRFRAMVKTGGYIQVPVVNYPTDEQLVLELDVKAGVNANLGGVLQLRSTAGKSIYALSIKNGQLYVFDNPVGYVGTDWVHIILVFDNELNDSGLYTCTAHFGSKGYLECTYDIGVVNELRIGGETSSIEEKYGDWFGVDNLQLYSGTNRYVTIPDGEYGAGVDREAEKTLDLELVAKPEPPINPDLDTDTGMGAFTNNLPANKDPNFVLRGEQELDRIDIPSGNPDGIYVRYNRGYAEGWDWNVGASATNNTSGSIFKLEAEQMMDLSYNYYMHYEQQTNTNRYWNFSTGSYPREGSLFMEFDLKAVEGCNVSGIIQMMAVSESANDYLLEFINGSLYTNKGTVNLGKISEDEWTHVAVQFYYDYAIDNPGTDPANYVIRLWVGDSVRYEWSRKVGTGGFGHSAFRIGFEGSAATNNGQFWCMDNFKVYGGDSFANIAEDVYGDAINPDTVKDFPIQTTTISLDTMITESLFMKIGCEWGLVNYERTPNLTDANGVAYGCPTLIDDTVWIPIDVILNFLSYPIYQHEDGKSFDISTGSKVTYITIGRSTAKVGGQVVNLTAAPAIVTDKLGYEFLAVTLEDIAILFPEFKIGRDDMNMITFGKYEQVTSGTMSMLLRIELMKTFLYEYIEPEEFYNRTKEHTNNFDHPYLITNQARFDELSAVWHAGRYALDKDPSNDVEYDATLYKYINATVNSARSYYNRFSAAKEDMASAELGVFNVSGARYEGLNPICYIYDSEATSLGLRHPYKSTAGYDPVGGRLNPPFDPLEPVAYAYQITKDIRFAQWLFDYCSLLCDWDHWGPGHFLNCADTAASIAVAYDWCYDVWVELGLDVDRIADGLFYHGTLQGYFVTIGQPDTHGRSGSGSNYTTMVNNWNPVCTSGIAASAFALMGYTGYSVNTRLEISGHNKASERAEVYGGDAVTDVCTTVLARNFKTLISRGLEIYAPDGSYEESVSYWAYGANNLFRYCSILESSMGTDLGLMDTWGLDRTCYSIMHMVSSDFRVFAYNDGSVGGACSSGWFNYVAQCIGDDFLRLVRNMHINDGGLGISFIDAIFYKPVDVTDDLDMPLQYHHIGINGYTVRSSWERGAIFAGILGGDNDDGHGHVDAGQWIYYAQGIPFIEDIGPDGYNTYNYFSSTTMYKTNPEGHSVILVAGNAKVRDGQVRHSVSPVIETYDDEHGAYVIINTAPAFSSHAVINSKRGMLFTNDRKTVIVQDEILPTGAQTFWWLAHYNADTISSVEITNNGRTALFTSSKKASTTGKPVVMRMNMVSPTPGIKFEKMTAYDFLLESTDRPGFSESMGKQPEGDRSNWLKLAVKFDKLMTVAFSVVLEVINPDAPITTGYKFTDMSEWTTYADTREQIKPTDKPSVEAVVNRGTAKPSDLLGYSTRLTSLVNSGTHFEQLADFYTAITQMTYTVDKLGRDYFEKNPTFTDSLALYDYYYQLYATYQADTKLTSDSIFALTDLLVAAKPKAAAVEG